VIYQVNFNYINNLFNLINLS